MAFRGVDFARLVKFNSANSSDFLDMYNKHVQKAIIEKNTRMSHKAFAPSGFRCPRKQWFRLRGVQPDSVKGVDTVLNFTAEMGTACHRILQSNIQAMLGESWIDVEDYLTKNPIPYEYVLTPSEDSLETFVEIVDPPFRFACDGIIRWKDKYYILEIKTAEHGTFDDLTDPKSEHIDQVKSYASLLGIHDVLFLYQDRQYGDLKCYEMHVSAEDVKHVLDTVNIVMEAVRTNLAPSRLPKGDAWCSRARCPYFNSCKQWG